MQERGETAQVAAATLAQFARVRAADPTHLSPFAYGAQQLGYRFFGGKMDDITVLVAYVEPVAGNDKAQAEAAAPHPAGAGSNGGGADSSSSSSGGGTSKL